MHLTTTQRKFLTRALEGPVTLVHAAEARVAEIMLFRKWITATAPLHLSRGWTLANPNPTPGLEVQIEITDAGRKALANDTGINANRSKKTTKENP